MSVFEGKREIIGVGGKVIGDWWGGGGGGGW